MAACLEAGIPFQQDTAGYWRPGDGATDQALALVAAVARRLGYPETRHYLHALDKAPQNVRRRIQALPEEDTV